MPRAAMSVRGLRVGYSGGEPVLRGVSFDLYAGDKAVVLGRNGNGKSTLLHALAGLPPVRRGARELFGERAAGRPGNFFRRRVGLATQNPNYQLSMDSVRNEVYLNCGDAVRAEAILGAFGSQGLRDRHPYTLSEGEKRRAATAAVVASVPALLLLDEPTLGQDRPSLIRMIAMLR